MSAIDEADELSPARCLQLLASQSLGRIALSERALPSILPVTYRLIDNRVVFVTLTGAPALGEGQRPVVAFQVDDIDPQTGAGWSVVVVGVADQIDTDPPGGNPLGAGAASFQQNRPGLLAGLSTDHISGRTFGSSH